MTYKRLAALAIAKAQYQIDVERRCRYPNGMWVSGVGPYLHFELLENYQAMLEADPKAMDRYVTIASLVPRLPSDVVDKPTRHEIELMLKKARKICTEYHRRFDRDTQFVDFMRKTAASIASNLHKMKTTGA